MSLDGLVEIFKNGEIWGILGTYLVALLPFIGVICSIISKFKNKSVENLAKIKKELELVKENFNALKSELKQVYESNKDMIQNVKNLSTANIIAYTNSNLSNSVKAEIVKTISTKVENVATSIESSNTTIKNTKETIQTPPSINAIIEENNETIKMG